MILFVDIPRSFRTKLPSAENNWSMLDGISRSGTTVLLQVDDLSYRGTAIEVRVSIKMETVGKKDEDILTRNRGST